MQQSALTGGKPPIGTSADRPRGRRQTDCPSWAACGELRDRRARTTLTWAEEPVQLFHYRDRDQVEVDVVLEHAAGTVIGAEVRPPRPSAPRTSVACATWRTGWAAVSEPGWFSTQDNSSSFGDQMTALPMAAQWTLDGAAS
jgi:hypothetical protein